MTRYTKQFIETEFKGIASSRISQKKLGESKYANDAGYWDGGRCNWGGAHNLAEDCEKLAKFFTGIAELRNSQKELLTFNNQKEFEKNKQKLLAKVDGYISGLNMKTSNTTSIGGVCCIWSDFADHFNKIINNFRNEIERLKNDIERVPYNEAKELLKLLSDERKIKKEIEENERKAHKEPDENKRKQFIFLADQAKGKWKKLLERKQQLKTAKLGDNFNPDAHIDKFFKELEDKLNARNKPSQPLRNPNPNSYPSVSGSNTNHEPTNIRFPSAEYILSSNDEPKPFLEKRWKEILLVVFYLIGSYYILNQKDSNHE